MYLTVKEAAEKLAVTPAAVYIAVKDGRLRSQKIYGKTVLREADVTDYERTLGQRNGWVNRGKNNTAQPKRNIMELRGLGKEIWQGTDTKEYVSALRDEWD